MRSRLMRGAIAAAGLAVLAGCTAVPNTATPTGPTPAPTIDNLVGDWYSPFTTVMIVNGTETGCSRHSYTISKIDANSASVSYDLTCAGYDLRGTAAGVFQDSVLKWTAGGTVGNGGCAFTFTDDTATARVGEYKIVVAYKGTVCGVGPFSGSILLQPR